MSRTGKFFKNIKFVLVFQVIDTVVRFFCRRVFVAVLIREYLGLNGIFSNIISVLSLAELGVGTAITYSLYKPLAEGNREQIAGLMALFRRLYWVIGSVIAVLGVALTPLLPVLIRKLPDIPNIQLMYLLFVLNSAVSYFFSYKQMLLTADQRGYIVTICGDGISVLMQIVQALFLWLTKEYFVYLGVSIAATLIRNIVLSCVVDRIYPFLGQGNADSLPGSVKQEILRNIKALLFHKIGGVVVLATDNLLISGFVGVVAVGLYSNYQMITNRLNAIYGQFYKVLIASVGNLGATENTKHSLEVFWRLNLVGNWLYGFSTVCLTVLMNPFIELWLGNDYLFGQGIVCLIALNFYVTGMRRIMTTFREGYGLYWYDRYKPVAESIINLGTSIALAIPFGVAGILAGTFIGTMLTSFWIEPLVLFKYGFHASVKPFFRNYAVNTLTTVVTIVLVWNLCMLLPGEGLLRFAAEMVVCAVLGNLGYLIAYLRRDEFKFFLQLLRHRISR